MERGEKLGEERNELYSYPDSDSVLCYNEKAQLPREFSGYMAGVVYVTIIPLGSVIITIPPQCAARADRRSQLVSSLYLASF